MEQTVTYLETGSQDPFYNLAFEEYVLTHRSEGEYLMLWQNDNTIVIGQNQNTEEEINRAFVEANGIHVVRRTTGGGAVYHDLGNLNYSFISDYTGIDHAALSRFTGPIVRALEGLGVHAETSGRNDILAEGHKVSGTAQRVTGGRILYHGTLLFDSDPEMVAGALHADPEKFRSKSTKSVRSRIGNIRAYLRQDMELPEFWDYLKGVLSESGITHGALRPEELEAVAELKRTKYDTWEWNFGRSPDYSMQNRRRFPGGTVEVRMEVTRGRIAELRFFGDFLSLRPLDDLTAALRGCAYSREDIAALLGAFPLEQYFGSVTKDEILETIFGAKTACNSEIKNRAKEPVSLKKR